MARRKRKPAKGKTRSTRSHARPGKARTKPRTRTRTRAPRAPARAARPLVVGGPHARLSQRQPLARELLALYAELGRLGRATRDDDERLRLREQQDAVGVQIDEALSRTIREDTREYAAAATAMVAASRRIEDALADLALVSDAIVSAARMVDAVAKVLTAAG